VQQRRGELRAEGADVPLVLADQWMPGRTGTQFLARVRHLYPTARRATVRGWQNGTSPLFCLPHGQLRQLAAALRDAGAQVGQDLGELLLALHCDLLITGMLRGFEDYAEVPPIDEEGPEADAAQALLSWALTSAVPERFRSYVRATHLMSRPDVGRFAALARGLKAGDSGLDLIPFGVALVALTQV
jgi:hypothetical protein